MIYKNITDFKSFRTKIRFNFIAKLFLFLEKLRKLRVNIIIFLNLVCPIHTRKKILAPVVSGRVYGLGHLIKIVFTQNFV
jgi:hypothetical protein